MLALPVDLVADSRLQTLLVELDERGVVEARVAGPVPEQTRVDLGRLRALLHRLYLEDGRLLDVDVLELLEEGLEERVEVDKRPGVSDRRVGGVRALPVPITDQDLLVPHGSGLVKERGHQDDLVLVRERVVGCLLLSGEVVDYVPDEVTRRGVIDALVVGNAREGARGVYANVRAWLGSGGLNVDDGWRRAVPAARPSAQ